MKLSVGQKVQRVVKFLIALRNARIAAALGQYGFRQVDLDEGWKLFVGVARTKLDAPPEVVEVDPDALLALDEWENKWFPVAKATLKRRAPKAHGWVFRNLSQTEGLAVIVSVGTFVERYEELDKQEELGDEGKEARKILEFRGLTKETVGIAKALLKKLRKVDGPLPDLEQAAADDISLAEAEEALWDWYLEWSKIARTAITQRSLLRLLGFLQTSANGKDEAVEEEDEGEEPEVPPTGKPSSTPK
jgi:hypothetical protein